MPMAASPALDASGGLGRQPHNPISRRQIETVVSRSAAITGVVFGAQAVPVVLDQLPHMKEGLASVMIAAVFGGLVASVIASFARKYVRAVNAYVAFAFLVALISWPFVAVDPSAVAAARPWLWLLVSIATSAAAVALSTWAATVYLVVAPVVYGIVRVTPSGGGKSWVAASLDTVYAIILGGALLILITLLRQAAASVDAAQVAALERYAHAVRQHATEVERVQVDSIVHDSVLTTFLSATRANTPEAKELATRMARNAIGHLKDAAETSPDDDATMSMDQLAHRITGATSTLSAPFELRTQDVGTGVISVQSAEAVYSASVQAMVNSLQHAGNSPDVSRWISIEGDDGGIRVEVGDTGAGFAVDAVLTERLGLRVSIIERVANAGGLVEIESGAGVGTVIRILWPRPAGSSMLAGAAWEQEAVS
jgi:signal transduction histidine kinase